jgi:hypothetical protein
MIGVLKKSKSCDKLRGFYQNFEKIVKSHEILEQLSALHQHFDASRSRNLENSII